MVEGNVRNIETVVIGGGQAGLSMGYHLQRHGRSFVILDAGQRTGDAWRNRWDSLRLFTPARFSGLDGMRFPGSPDSYPTKDEMANYLERYARHFDLPIELGARVARLRQDGDAFVVETHDAQWRADNVVVAMGHEQMGWRPSFSTHLDARVFQIHSVDYRNPGQLVPGNVLVVGAANSGVEIALDLAPSREVMIAGNHPGAIPFDIEGFLGRKLLVRLVLRGVFHRLLSIRTPIGRKARSALLSKGKPLVRSKPSDLTAAGIARLPRIERVEDGLPVTVDGRKLDVANVVWATGFRPGFAWIELDVGGDHPRETLGVADDYEGLYFVGLDFITAPSSGQIHGVGRDAARIAGAIADRARHQTRAITV